MRLTIQQARSKALRLLLLKRKKKESCPAEVLVRMCEEQSRSYREGVYGSEGILNCKEIRYKSVKRSYYLF